MANLLLLVPNGNDDDVIINYITDIDLGEDSDSRSDTRQQTRDISWYTAQCTIQLKFYRKNGNGSVVAGCTMNIIIFMRRNRYS